LKFGNLDRQNRFDKNEGLMEGVLSVLTSPGAVFLYVLGGANFVVFRVIRQITQFLGAPISAADPSPRGMSLLSEKSAPVKDAAAATKLDGNEPKQTDLYALSYSRACGSLGMIVMAGMLFALGNYILWASFFDKSIDILDKIGSFFLAGSSLFAPYAFNQLGSVFKAK
jgi:hypothetical protein